MVHHQLAGLSLGAAPAAAAARAAALLLAAAALRLPLPVPLARLAGGGAGWGGVRRGGVSMCTCMRVSSARPGDAISWRCPSWISAAAGPPSPAGGTRPLTCTPWSAARAAGAPRQSRFGRPPPAVMGGRARAERCMGRQQAGQRAVGCVSSARSSPRPRGFRPCCCCSSHSWRRAHIKGGDAVSRHAHHLLQQLERLFTKHAAALLLLPPLLLLLLPCGRRGDATAAVRRAMAAERQQRGSLVLS